MSKTRRMTRRSAMQFLAQFETDIAVQMYNRAIMPTMWAKLRSGQTVKQATDWAAHEIEGFIRN